MNYIYLFLSFGIGGSILVFFISLWIERKFNVRTEGRVKDLINYKNDILNDPEYKEIKRKIMLKLKS